MIHSLTGTISGSSEGQLFMETGGGVEWVLQASTFTIDSARRSSKRVRILTHLHHRDDQMTMFGFGTIEERSVFLDLLKVSGIGPRQALRILSGMSVDDFVKNMDAEDVDSLSRIPGLGKKTAQKILLTLRGKLSLSKTSVETEHDEITEALVEMGFDRAQAHSAVNEVRSDPGGDGELEEGELLRRAIVRLSASE